MKGGVSYLIQPGDYGFTPEDVLEDATTHANLLDSSNNVYLAIGAHKSVRFVSGPKEQGACVLVVESKRLPRQYCIGNAMFSQEKSLLHAGAAPREDSHQLAQRPRCDHRQRPRHSVRSEQEVQG